MKRTVLAATAALAHVRGARGTGRLHTTRRGCSTRGSISTTCPETRLRGTSRGSWVVAGPLFVHGGIGRSDIDDSGFVEGVGSVEASLESDVYSVGVGAFFDCRGASRGPCNRLVRQRRYGRHRHRRRHEAGIGVGLRRGFHAHRGCARARARLAGVVHGRRVRGSRNRGRYSADHRCGVPVRPSLGRAACRQRWRKRDTASERRSSCVSDDDAVPGSRSGRSLRSAVRSGADRPVTGRE